MSETLGPLPDISEDAPAGENLEFDPDFSALERACTGKPEAQFGDTIIPAVPPEWKEARTIAAALNERTRDLRILVLSAQTELNLAGLPGFAAVVSQIRQQIEERWESVHPQLDPEDDNDPTLRANALFRLQDPAWVMKIIRDMPLVSSPMTGPVTWRDIAIFEGAIEVEDGVEKMTETFIRGAFSSGNAERLAAVTAAVGQLLGDLDAIGAAFDAHAGYGTGPDLSGLIKLLRDIQGKLETYNAGGEAAEDFAGGAEDDAAAAEDGGEAGGEPRPSGGAGGRSGGGGVRRGAMDVRSITAVTTREDALYLLEVASAYFKASEPSSPVPMLVDRARRLAGMSFMDVVRELAPGGVMEVQVIAGPEDYNN